MQQFVGFGAREKYSVFVAVNERGEASKPVRVEHERETFRTFLRTLPSRSDIAVESTGFWYWIVDEMEAANHQPHLANTLEAKKRMGRPHKSDPLDAKGLGILLRNGTLPECWIPPRELRDQRELLRTRMALRDLSTRASSTAFMQPCSATVCTLSASAISLGSADGSTCTARWQPCRQRLGGWSCWN